MWAVQGSCSQQSDSAALLPAMVESCPVALCIVDAVRQVHFANAEFKQMMRLCAALGQGTRIAVQNSPSATELRNGIAAVSETGCAQTIQITMPDHMHDLSVLITSMAAQSLVLLTIIPPRTMMISKEQQYRTLRLKWSLSQREAECALQLGQGLTAQRIADAQNVSLATVRTHLQAIREKLVVNNSLEAAIMIARLSRPCGGQI